MYDPYPAPISRRPRGLVRINGTPITGWEDWEVESNSFYSADSFSVQFAGADLPADRSVKWFSQQRDMYVELFAGFPVDPDNFTANDLKSWIYGQVDTIDYDPVQNVVQVHGRDLSRVFIDAKTTEKWPNKTASEIAELQAKRHGLAASVAKTKTQVGKYYQIDHVSLKDQRTEWDILAYLAQIEGFRVWVRGQTLYFQPGPTPATADRYQLIWTPATNGQPGAGNFENLKLSRTLTVSRGIVVTIHSWDHKHRHGFSVSYPTHAKKLNPGQAKIGSDAQNYQKTIPNLTQQQALQRARQLYEQIVAHEMKLAAELPADDVLDTMSIIELTGTGTAYDQLYYPESITRRLSFEGGYSMAVHAKNHAPESEPGQ
jgi:phage protein D